MRRPVVPIRPTALTASLELAPRGVSPRRHLRKRSATKRVRSERACGRLRGGDAGERGMRAIACAHLTHFLVFTRCSHCLDVRLGPLPSSIFVGCPCELGRSRARPATRWCVSAEPVIARHVSGQHGPSRPPGSRGSRSVVSGCTGGGSTLQPSSGPGVRQGGHALVIAGSGGGSGGRGDSAVRAATRESGPPQARRTARRAIMREAR